MRLNGVILSSRALMGVALALAICLLLGTLDAAETYVKTAQAGVPCTWWRALGQGLSLWLAWAILAQPIALLVYYYPFEQRHWLPALGVYLLAGAVGALIKMVMDYPIVVGWGCYGPVQFVPLEVYLRSALTGYLLRYMLIFWAIAGVWHARNYYRQSRERERLAARLESQLAQAQLEYLQAQLHPHFLFNTLNAISTLIHRDTEVADRMLARLGQLLRLSLDNAGTQEVTLGKELEFLKAYLEIEQVRFGPRLHVTIDVDPELLETPVPYLVLQPLVENAIKHGMAATGRAGQIGVTAQRGDGCLVLEVCDDGPGLAKRPTGKRIGIGLANVRARLEQAYGVDYRLELVNRPGGGVLATIELPLIEDAFNAERDALEPQFSDVP